MKACIVAVGSEMLTPFRVDTNSLVITERLNAVGYDVRLKAVAADHVEELARVIEGAMGWADLIVITGGLGPTEDDITRDAVAQLVTIVLLFAIGSWSGTVAERHFAMVDPPPVVIDEVMGMLLTLFMAPVGWRGALIGFFLFRVADVVKPFPAGRLERLPGGIGVMADDGMAAVYANLALRAASAIWHLTIG